MNIITDVYQREVLDSNPGMTEVELEEVEEYSNEYSCNLIGPPAVKLIDGPEG